MLHDLTPFEFSSFLIFLPINVISLSGITIVRVAQVTDTKRISSALLVESTRVVFLTEL